MPVKPSPRRPGLLALALAAAAALALAPALPAARAQFNAAEPPDLPADAFPAPSVGTVGVGLNTFNGTVSASWTATGAPAGDDRDLFALTVPAGVAVTGIEFVVTNFACSGCAAGVASAFVVGNSVPFTGNGTFALPLASPITAGRPDFQVIILRAAGGAGSASLSYQVRITAVPSSNDTCRFATPIGLGATAFNSTGATTDGLPHPGACNFFGNPSVVNDLWYTYTAQTAGLLTVSTCGSEFDTELNVYRSITCPGTDATLLACNDDSAGCGFGSNQSQLSLTVAAGQTYLIRVGGYDGGFFAGPGTLTLGLVTTGACCNRRTGGCLVLTLADCQAFGGTLQAFGSVCSPNPCVACPGDFDNSGTRSVDDIFIFLAAWFAGCP